MVIVHKADHFFQYPAILCLIDFPNIFFFNSASALVQIFFSKLLNHVVCIRILRCSTLLRGGTFFEQNYLVFLCGPSDISVATTIILKSILRKFFPKLQNLFASHIFYIKAFNSMGKFHCFLWFCSACFCVYFLRILCFFALLLLKFCLVCLKAGRSKMVVDKYFYFEPAPKSSNS